MSLFKYAPPERIDVIQNLRIRFTPGTEFNDPFEITPSASFIDDPKYLEGLLDRMAKKQFAEEFAEGKVAIDGKAARIAAIVEHRKIELIRDKAGIKAAALEAMRTRFSDYRILCLSRVAPEDPKALLLWAHYTNGHTGFVFEIAEADPWILSHDSCLGHLRDKGDVEYRKTRPVLESGAVRRNCYLAKSEHWIYEQEFRLVRASADPELDFKTSLVTIPPTLLLSITLGANVGPKEIERVQSVLDSRPELAHVQLFQAQLHVDEYSIVNRPYNRR